MRVIISQNEFPRRNIQSPREYGIILAFHMCMMDEITAKRDRIHAIAKGHKAEKLWVFGSCARKEERPDSDVDFLIKFDPSVGHKDYTAIEQGLSSLLGRAVDVVSTRVLPSSPRFANRVCKEAIAI